nr:acetyl-coA carboxylase beta subunit [Ranalisma rostratum]UDZ59267.1 acetyl-coA carboxylase beta subunit [Ranalisma rostratum]
MKKRWFHSISSNKELERRCELNKSMYSLYPIGHTSENGALIINHNDKNISNWNDSGSCHSSNVEHLFDIKGIWGLISDDTFLVRDSNGDSYSIYFDIENQILEIDNGSSFLNELKSFFSNYLISDCFNSRSKSMDHYYYYYIYDTQSSWNNHINSCIDSYLRFEISMDSYISGGTVNYSDSYIYSNESRNSSMTTSGNGNNFNNNFNISVISNDLDINSNDLDINSNDLDINQKYKDLWVQCENCYELNYKKFFKSKMNICEHCGYHLKMSSSDRIELLVDPGTWDPINEDMVSTDPIEFHSEEEPYRDRIDFYQRKTGLTEAVQTGIGQLNGIPIAIGVMDFEFMGGSMGSVVGEKITRLIEYASNRSLPVIIVCASGGARMQEGSLSLIQMAKISSALYDYQLNKKLFYVPILTSPTTGGVTASFGMLGDVIIGEPYAYIAFAGKRVIEETLKKTIPDGSQESEYLFYHGLLDLIVPRNLLKGVLSELFQLHGFLPLNKN